MTDGATIGIDVGATGIKAGVVDGRGQVGVRRAEPVAPSREAQDVVAQVVGLVGALESAASSGALAVGMAAPGLVDLEGVVRESPNFPAWSRVPLQAMVADALGRSVAFTNDANAAAWAEARAGAAAPLDSLLAVTLGSGVGGGLVLAGKIWRGDHGMAGELGHVTVDVPGRTCGCGGAGCLEQYAGAVGLRRSMVEAGGDLAPMARSEDAPRLLAEAAAAGHETAVLLFEDLGRKLGIAIATYVHVLDVRTIVLLGGIAQSIDLFRGAMEQAIEDRAYGTMTEGLHVAVGSLGLDAGIIGAALLARA